MQKIALSRVISSWLVALFLLAQSAALLHAEVHPFHEHNSYCDAFDRAADPRIDVPNYSPSFDWQSFVAVALVQSLPSYRSDIQTVYHSRAPPLNSSF